MRVIVVGGMTLVGALLGDELRAAGHEAAALGSDLGPDVVSDDELAAAFGGADAVVDVSECTSVLRLDVRADVEAGVHRVLAAVRSAGVRHLVLASTVGLGRLFASEHFLARIAAEQLVETSSIPYSIVRTTQLFESIPALAGAAAGGTEIRVARVLVEPIAAADVAQELAAIAVGPATGSVMALAGPEPFHLDDLVRWTLELGADGRAVVTDPDACVLGAELSGRTPVPGGHARHTSTRFADWLTNPRGAPPHV